MVQLRPPGKAYEVAKKVLKQQGVKVPKRDVIEKVKLQGPYMQR
jgi:hypothetical protein